MDRLPDELAIVLPSQYLTCDEARNLALADRRSASLAFDASRSCKRVDLLLERANAAMIEYVELLFAHAVRTTPDAAVFRRNLVSAVPLATGVTSLMAVGWEGQTNIVLLRDPENGDYASPRSRLDRQAVPEVRAQINALLAAARVASYGQAFGIRAHRKDDDAAETEVPLLWRVVETARVGASGIIAALRSGALTPANLRGALAQAVANSRVMNAASTTGAATIDPSMDVDAVLASTGVDPRSLAWIEAAAIALSSATPRAQLRPSDVERLLAQLT